MKFETKAIRIQTENSQHREHSTPIYPTSSFVYDSAEQMGRLFSGEEKGNIYSRFSNPSVREFEEKMAALEGTENAMAAASGMAAIFASFMAFLKEGDHLIASGALFGSSWQVVSDTLPKLGISFTMVDSQDIESWESAVQDNTKMVFLETPSNPGLTITDLKAVGKFCKKHKLIYNVDNCFATPYLQNPKKFGADLVTHSATKFIDGQGRVLGGAVCGSNEHIAKVYAFIRRTGASLSPFNAWVLSKSLETLAVRMDRHCDNAEALAKYLNRHPKVNKINYPHHRSHTQYDIAKKQMKRGGGVVTFEIKGGLRAGKKFLNKVKMCSLTANLGDSRTIVSHPASTTHAKLPQKERLDLDITNGLIRVSVGLEHIDDIKNDIKQALG